jgi:serine/threonine-protein kinase RsbW
LLVSSLASSRRELGDERVDDLKLAVSEACANAIESCAGGTGETRLRVEWAESPDRLEISVQDEGSGFVSPDPPPATRGAGSGAGLADRGLGIPLIRALVDEVTFTSTLSGTQVRMTLYCAPAPPPGKDP